MFFRKKKKNAIYFIKNFCIILGIVLIWRGIWYVLDYVDHYFFNGGHIGTALFGVVFGILLLYLPDGDLKELQKL